MSDTPFRDAAAESAAETAPPAPAETVGDTMSRVDATLAKCESFHEAWARFQATFDRFNEKLLNSIAAGMGQPEAASDGTNGLSPAERAAVLFPDGAAAGEPSLAVLCGHLKAGRYRNVVLCVGAGISTSAGIPDFSSPGTGLYTTLLADQQRDAAAAGDGDLSPQELLSVERYRVDPRPFLRRYAAFWPPDDAARPALRPTAAHAFMRVLCDMGVVRRIYTQNIDGLERAAGIPEHLVVQCHGNLRSVHCTACPHTLRLGDTPAGGGAMSYDDARRAMRNAEAVRCSACGDGYLKPSIVMFGEQLDRATMSGAADDLDAECDLLIVMGTSLRVAPVASLPSRVRATVPRLLLNQELVGPFVTSCAAASARGASPSRAANYRDVAHLGAIDASCHAAARLLGREDRFFAACRELKCREQPTTVPRQPPRRSVSVPRSRVTTTTARAPASRSRSKPSSTVRRGGGTKPPAKPK
jgi:NAD-dependent SIR2 family protein deacetylase